MPPSVSGDVRDVAVMTKACLTFFVALTCCRGLCLAEAKWTSVSEVLADYREFCSKLSIDLSKKHPRHPDYGDGFHYAQHESYVKDYVAMRIATDRRAAQYPQSAKFLTELAETEDSQHPFVFRVLWYLAPYRRKQNVMWLFSDGRALITGKDRWGTHGTFFARLDKERLAKVRAKLAALQLEQKSPLPKVGPGRLHIGFAYMRDDSFVMVTFLDRVPDSLRETIDIVVAALPKVKPRSHLAPWFCRPRPTTNANQRPAGNTGQ